MPRSLRWLSWTASFPCWRAARCGSSAGLYVGCGNGRNYPAAGGRGTTALWARSVRRVTASVGGPEPRRIRAADSARNFGRGQSRRRFGYVIAIQVFQHGVCADVAGYFEKVASVLDPGGLFFLRVNSASTEIYHPHTVIERNDLGGVTVHYDAGPKQDLPVHFFSRDELLDLTGDCFDVVDAPCEELTVAAGDGLLGAVGASGGTAAINRDADSSGVLSTSTQGKHQNSSENHGRLTPAARTLAFCKRVAMAWSGPTES